MHSPQKLMFMGKSFYYKVLPNLSHTLALKPHLYGLGNRDNPPPELPWPRYLKACFLAKLTNRLH